MDCSTPDFPVLHYLQEFAQTHAHWVNDAIQPSHPLSRLGWRGGEITRMVGVGQVKEKKSFQGCGPGMWSYTGHSWGRTGGEDVSWTRGKEVEQVYALRLPSSCEIVSFAEGGEDRVMVLENKEKKCVTAYLANERKWTRNEILLKYC